MGGVSTTCYGDSGGARRYIGEVTRTIVDVLAERVRTDGSRPLLTYYNPSRGERTEFSATSFANWVDKTANLLDTLGVDGLVAGPVSVTAPCHWMGLVWTLAAWQRGLAYAAVLPPLPAHAQLAVVGPDDPTPLLPGATIACSLHPLGLALRDLPNGVLDYTSEALAEPDAHWTADVEPDAPCWFDDLREVSHADWLALPPEPDRVLVNETLPWLVLQEAVIRPLLGGGSAVLVAGEVSEPDLARIIASERARRAGSGGVQGDRSFPGVGIGRTS